MHVLTQDTACVLLHNMAGGEFKDVATGVLLQPANRMMHTIPLDDAVMRVRLARVLSGFDDLDPPIQPPGAEEHKTLAECFNWPLTWPKTQIRLGGIGRTTGATSIVRLRPRAPPPVIATTSRHQQLLGECVPPHGKGPIASQPPSPPPAREEEEMAPHYGDNDDGDDIDVHDFINTGGREGSYMPTLDQEEPFRARDDQTDPPLQRRLDYGLSQDTPPAADQTNKQTNPWESFLALTHSTRRPVSRSNPQWMAL